MEERTLNEKESLELITRMMQNTKMNLEVGSGNGLIIWGVSALMTNLIVFLLLYFTHNPISYCAWIMIPVIGMAWTKIASNSRVKATTKIDKMVRDLFNTTLIIVVILPFAFWALSTQLNQEQLIVSGYKLMSLIPFIVMLIFSLAIIANAIIIDFKPLRIGGIVGVILSICMLYESILVNAYIYCVWTIAAMIIPGIKLNGYIKSNQNV